MQLRVIWQKAKPYKFSLTLPAGPAASQRNRRLFVELREVGTVQSGSSSTERGSTVGRPSAEWRNWLDAW